MVFFNRKTTSNATSKKKVAKKKVRKKIASKKEGEASDKSASDNKVVVLGLDRKKTISSISSIDEIEGEIELLSGNKMPMQIPESQRSQIAILRVGGANSNKVILLYTETAKPENVDNYHGLLSNKKYTIQRLTSNSGLIKELYQKKQASQTQHDPSELTKEFNQLITNAVEIGASDIHIENLENKTVVRMRVNGLMREVNKWTTTYGQEMARVIYGVHGQSTDVTYNPNIPQSGIIDMEVANEKIRIRLQTLNRFPEPSNDLILRILKMGVKVTPTPFFKLGYLPEQIKLIEKAISRPKASTVIAGTTGSGKSTTLQSIMLNRIAFHENRQKVITVEDPVEYKIPGATQVSVVTSKDINNDEESDSYATFIKTVLRSDPDICMIGEIRNKRAANAFTEVVLTGHQTFTTIHAGSAFNIVIRLDDKGIKPHLLRDPEFISALMYQTLLPVLCADCSIPFEMYIKSGLLVNKDEYVDRVRKVAGKKIDQVKARNPAGCECCGHTGIISQSVAAEIVVPDDDILNLLNPSTINECRELWLSRGGISVLQHGINKVLNGMVDPFYVEQKIDRLDSEPLHKINQFNGGEY